MILFTFRSYRAYLGMPYKQITGIYKITNKVNNKSYIGSSLSIYRRFATHRKLLNNNKHYNTHFQSSWNKYGGSNFDFSILEECLPDILEKQEETWILTLKANNRLFGFNKRIDCKTNRGIVFSQETKEKLRLTHLGHKRTKEAHEKILKSQYKRVCQMNLNGELLNTFSSLKEASITTKVGKTLISACCNKKLPHAGFYFWCFEKNFSTFIKPTIPVRTCGWTNGKRNINKRKNSNLS